MFDDIECLPGIKVIELNPFNDLRGNFIKTYSSEIISQVDIEYTQIESFVSVSKKNVLRGMHYQTVNNCFKYKKLVTCIMGSAIDVIVDINKDSKWFNKPYVIRLSADRPVLISMPVYYAHGFLALEDNTVMQYSTNLRYEKSGDKGIHWKSINFEWPVESPIVSMRDDEHYSLQ